ncbi:Aminomethyltransferase folate-binding domain-containing protein [Dipodascopsis tothii]|uniref:Aminomethyltransferase folate-binding domain-containing protein n=1 Tax=Dipodascopsis tothii TaxID=44089 RepID=UPI0034CEF3EA
MSALLAVLRRPPALLRAGCRWASSGPALPPAIGCADLSGDRALVRVSGADASHFLHGITTNRMPEEDDDEGIYTAFLTAKGRVLYDTFVYPAHTNAAWATEHGEEPAYLVDCARSRLGELLTHLRRHKLRSKVKFGEVADWQVWTCWDAGSTEAGTPLAKPPALLGLADNRVPGLGLRVVVPAAAPLSVQAPGLTEVPAASYALRRILHGVPEGEPDITVGGSLPMEVCLDHMGAIDFDKGCYLGQELTIRTKHRGVVRKRLVPVELHALDAAATGTYDAGFDAGAPPPLVALHRADGTGGGRRGAGVGELHTVVGNVGLAVVRLEHADAPLVARWDGPDGPRAVGVAASVPGWWPEE